MFFGGLWGILCLGAYFLVCQPFVSIDPDPNFTHSAGRRKEGRQNNSVAFHIPLIVKNSFPSGRIQEEHSEQFCPLWHKKISLFILFPSSKSEVKFFFIWWKCLSVGKTANFKEKFFNAQGFISCSNRSSLFCFACLDFCLSIRHFSMVTHSSPL